APPNTHNSRRHNPEPQRLPVPEGRDKAPAEAGNNRATVAVLSSKAPTKEVSSHAHNKAVVARLGIKAPTKVEVRPGTGPEPKVETRTLISAGIRAQMYNQAAFNSQHAERPTFPC